MRVSLFCACTCLVVVAACEPPSARKKIEYVPAPVTTDQAPKPPPPVVAASSGAETTSGPAAAPPSPPPTGKGRGAASRGLPRNISPGDPPAKDAAKDGPENDKPLPPEKGGATQAEIDAAREKIRKNPELYRDPPRKGAGRGQ